MAHRPSTPFAAVLLAAAALFGAGGPARAQEVTVYCSVLADWCQLMANEFTRTSELLARRKLAAPGCWSDLVKPEYRDEIQVSNPASSGTAYTVIATLVQ